jgi:hypothetical protein
MAIDDEDRDREASPDDRGYLPSIQNPIIRNLIGRADELALQKLTSAEYGRMADADQSIDQLGKAKEELVLKVLERQGPDWGQRLTPLEKSCFERGEVAEDSLRVSVARREMSREEWIEYEDMEERLGEAWKTYDELLRLAMERRAEEER